VLYLVVLLCSVLHLVVLLFDVLHWLFFCFMCCVYLNFIIERGIDVDVQM
jgi:hypothetical protein